MKELSSKTKAILQAINSRNPKQMKQARSSCLAILKITPNNTTCLRFMGIIDYYLGNTLRATKWFENALNIKPSPELYYNYAQTMITQKKYASALTALRQAMRLKPDFLDAYCLVGTVLEKSNELDKALKIYRIILKMNPNCPDALNRLGVLLMKKDNLEGAFMYLERAIAVKPDFSAAINNLGMLYHYQGLFDKSLKLFEKALICKPQNPIALNNLGIALGSLRRFDEAIIAYKKAINLKNDYPEAHKNLSLAQLATGQFSEGWRNYEWRWQTRQFTTAVCNPLKKTRWHGEAAKGRTLLIQAEQGNGDSLQFCRYIPLVAKRGFKIVLEVQPPLVRLMKSLPGVDKVIASGQRLPEFDLYCPMMSLPLVFNTQLNTILVNIPYLSVPTEKVKVWANRLSNNNNYSLRVGLVWAGKSSNFVEFAAVDRRRSVAPALFAPLTDVNGITFYSLQKDGPEFPADSKVINLMDSCDDFADTAALVANLDLVISVDTAVAHLAGALGKPVWVLNRFDSCWRWLTNREDSPWYPTLRLFRQPQPGDWKSVIVKVKTELAKLTKVASQHLCNSQPQ